MQLVLACLAAVLSHVSALSGNSLSGGGARGNCLAPYDVGTCNWQEEAWYYNEEEERCIFFVYSGCGGNANRFGSKQECEEACVEHYCPELDCPSSCRIATGTDGCEVCACTREEAAAVCRQPMKRGYCRALHHKWAWSQAAQTCVSFVYGGCGGNENSFDSEETCLRVCSEVRNIL